MEVKEKDNLLLIEFKNYTQAVNYLHKDKDYVCWGNANQFPHYLNELIKRNPIHGAIVSGKAQYVYGKGLSCSPNETILNQAKVLSFLERANRFETWNEIYKKTTKQYERFNGFAWQIIWNRGGTAFEVFKIEFGKLRRSPCGKRFFYCDAWIIDNNGTIEANPNPENHPSYIEFPAFNPNIRSGTSIFYYHESEASTMELDNLYPEQDYSGAIMSIETMIEIDIFKYHHKKNGMFASSLITLFNGEPTDDEKKKIKKMFDSTYIGSTNAGKAMLNFVDKGGTAADIKTLTTSDLDKMFEQDEKSCIQKIFTAHKAYPVLFGVMTEGSLSDTNGDSVLKKWDQFLRAYVEGRQNSILDQIKWMGEIQNVDLSNVEVKQTTPTGAEMPIDANIHKLFNDATLKNYYSKKFDVEIIGEEAEGVQMEALPVNENIKSLTGLQYKRIQSYVAKYKAGKITYEEASHFIKGYGLGDDYVKLALGEKKFSKQDRTDELLSLFEKFAIDDNDDPVLSEQYFHTEKEALKIELKAMKFEEEVSPELKNQVIDILTGDPMATPEKLAKLLGVNPLIILAAITALIAGGYLIETIPGSYQPTEKAINKEVEKVETEVYTVFSYVTRPDVPEAESSRPLCKKLLKLSREGKRWTREGIESITNEFGEDAWTYRGGFYTNPNTQETTPYCRHIWKAIIKTRKKGGKRG